MSTALLNPDGRASMATAFMTSHHAFRRDLARLGRALDAVVAGDTSRVGALPDAWRGLHEALHGHHSVEDAHIFPSLGAEHPELAVTLARLDADHQAVDVLLARGDAAFAALPDAVGEARLVIRELEALLRAHLDLEERDVVPHLRGAFAFPPTSSDEEAAMYADGFAWSTFGVAADIREALFQLVDARVRARLPAAREAFVARAARYWGPTIEGATRTSEPEIL